MGRTELFGGVLIPKRQAPTQIPIGSVLIYLYLGLSRTLYLSQCWTGLTYRNSARLDLVSFGWITWGMANLSLVDGYCSWFNAVKDSNKPIFLLLQKGIIRDIFSIGHIVCTFLHFSSEKNQKSFFLHWKNLDTLLGNQFRWSYGVLRVFPCSHEIHHIETALRSAL